MFRYRSSLWGFTVAAAVVGAVVVFLAVSVLGGLW
jgi:hypothetical protein